MANENDEVYGKDNTSMEGPTLCRRVDSDEAVFVGATQNVESSEAAVEEGACVYGKMNDLVADLCVSSGSGNRSQALASPYGDCTNIRATSGPTLHIEGIAIGHKQDTVQSDIQPTATTAAATTTVPTTQPHNSTSTFSFKHFLNSANSAVTAPSTTVTSLDAVGVTSSSAGSTTTTSNTAALQTSTGARPKVPQSSSASVQSISSLASSVAQGQGSSDINTFAASVTKMKRSPRFSSFDSQASLAEYAGAGVQCGYEDDSLFVGTGSGPPPHSSTSTTSSGFRLYPDALGRDNSDFFFGKKSNNECNNQTDRHPVPRSVSNYDMPAPSVSPRRRIVATSNCASREPRPTRLALNTNGNKLKLDLRLDNTAGASARPPSNNPGEFPPAAAAALPDFVQDHWLDSWYAHDMHLNSQPGSPISDFFEDFTSGSVAGLCSGGGPIGTSSSGRPTSIDSIGCREAGAAGGSSAVATAAAGGGGLDVSCNNPSILYDMSGPNDTSAGSKMLPDFLSDGPIIHSSQRLADVTVGLPSNSSGSPEEPTMSSQLSLLRIENERLQRELEDARVALCEQTRRADDYERQLHAADMEQIKPKTFYYRHAGVPDDMEVHDDKQRRSGGGPSSAQSHVSKLKQQVMQLTTEVELLRRENDLLREEGAVGGCSAPPDNGATAAMRHNTTKRPSKAKAISRDLLRAASNAELNLKQLLVGVDNLRQMAADIDSSETDSVKGEFDDETDLYNDFPDSCNYEE